MKLYQWSGGKLQLCMYIKVKLNDSIAVVIVGYCDKYCRNGIWKKIILSVRDIPISGCIASTELKKECKAPN